METMHPVAKKGTALIMIVWMIAAMRHMTLACGYGENFYFNTPGQIYGVALLITFLIGSLVYMSVMSGSKPS